MRTASVLDKGMLVASATDDEGTLTIPERMRLACASARHAYIKNKRNAL